MISPNDEKPTPTNIGSNFVNIKRRVYILLKKSTSEISIIIMSVQQRKKYLGYKHLTASDHATPINSMHELLIGNSIKTC